MWNRTYTVYLIVNITKKLAKLNSVKTLTSIFLFSVLYCTLLAQAQNEKEKVDIEEKMESEPELLKILQALQAIDKEDIVSEERSRRDQARKSRVAADIEAMDTDETQVQWCFI